MDSNPAVTFLRMARAHTPDDLLRQYARFLLESAGAYQLPVRLRRVRERFSLSVGYRVLPGQRGLTTEDARIFLNSGDRRTVQNFTFGHELVELLFLALLDGAADDWMGDDLFSALQERREQYCDRGAAELVMPMALFRDLAGREPLSLRWASRVAEHCGVSLTATLWRLLQTDPEAALCIIWASKHSPAQYVPSRVGQLSLFGPAEGMDPPKKLRIEQSFKAPRVLAFIPKDKSAPLDGAIHRAYLDGTDAAEWEVLDLGGIKGRFLVEARPFAVAGERRVLSLIHLDRVESPGC